MAPGWRADSSPSSLPVDEGPTASLVAPATPWAEAAAALPIGPPTPAAIGAPGLLLAAAPPCTASARRAALPGREAPRCRARKVRRGAMTESSPSDAAEPGRPRLCGCASAAAEAARAFGSAGNSQPRVSNALSGRLQTTGQFKYIHDAPSGLLHHTALSPS